MQYVDFVRQRLTAFADTDTADATAFVAAELKRFGFKLKTVNDCMYCDIGRAKSRIAFYAELADTYQTTVLLCFAAELAANAIVGVRLIFDGNTEDEHELVGEVGELYSAAICGGVPSDGIGCCYGVAGAGILEFSLKVIGGKETDVYSSVGQIAERYAIDCTTVGDGQSFVLRYFDKAKIESALLDIERIAQRYDDENGTEHALVVSKNYPPIKNDALCVDKVRQSAGDMVTLIRSTECSYAVSRYLDKICGCMISVGDGVSSDTVVRLFLRLADTRSING